MSHLEQGINCVRESSDGLGMVATAVTRLGKVAREFVLDDRGCVWFYGDVSCHVDLHEHAIVK